MSRATRARREVKSKIAARAAPSAARQLGGKRKTVAGKKALLRFETGAPTSLNKIDDFDSASSSESDASDSDSASEGEDHDNDEDDDDDEDDEKEEEDSASEDDDNTEKNSTVGKKKSAATKAKAHSPLYWNKKAKQRVMLCTSRNIPHRPRHFMIDLHALLPHSRKENKLDDRKSLTLLNELAELNNTSKVVYLECRRGTDLFFWMSHAPSGPSIKFQLLNEHTKDELKLTGNHLKGSRTLLSFDSSFDSAPHLRIMKNMLTQVFNVPYRARRTKPFFDHVMQFAWLDNKIWVRNYQISIEGQDTSDKAADPEMSLNEVGPRFVMDPVRIFRGSFEGESLWANPFYVTPGAIRRFNNAEARRKTQERLTKDASRSAFKDQIKVPEDPLAKVFKN